jgi:hypothetical protein
MASRLVRSPVLLDVRARRSERAEQAGRQGYDRPTQHSHHLVSFDLGFVAAIRIDATAKVGARRC